MNTTPLIAFYPRASGHIDPNRGLVLITLDDGRTWRRHVNQMRLIGQATPNQETDWDHGPVEDLIVRTESNVSESKTNDIEQQKESSQEIQQHPPDRSQPQQIEIVPQESCKQPKNVIQKGTMQKSRKPVIGSIVNPSESQLKLPPSKQRNNKSVGLKRRCFVTCKEKNSLKKERC